MPLKPYSEFAPTTLDSLTAGFHLALNAGSVSIYPLKPRHCGLHP